MNKLVFTLKNDFGSDMVLIANNHKDLEDHLKESTDWHSIKVEADCVIIKRRKGYESEIALLEWVKHI
tara:strand:+ start:336 stop:539 length:204 start_codon:yes stop_codon:yes gene_type:complete